MSSIRERNIERQLAKLAALEAGGVDNWDGYDFALEDWHKENEVEERADALLDAVCEVLGSGAYEPSERGAGFTFDGKAMDRAKDIILAALKEQTND